MTIFWNTSTKIMILTFSRIPDWHYSKCNRKIQWVYKTQCKPCTNVAVMIMFTLVCVPRGVKGVGIYTLQMTENFKKQAMMARNDKILRKF